MGRDEGKGGWREGRKKGPDPGKGEQEGWRLGYVLLRGEEEGWRVAWVLEGGGIEERAWRVEG